MVWFSISLNLLKVILYVQSFKLYACLNIEWTTLNEFLYKLLDNLRISKDKWSHLDCTSAPEVSNYDIWVETSAMGESFTKRIVTFIKLDLNNVCCNLKFIYLIVYKKYK